MPVNLGPLVENEWTDGINFTSTGQDVSFGFNANVIRLRNDATKSVYFTLARIAGATTSGHELKSSEELIFRDVDCAGFSFVATSSGGNLRVGAWGN